MPQKKAKKAVVKKAPPLKAKKPVKLAKSSGLGAALKSAAKSVSKNLGLAAAPAKKPVPAKNAGSAKSQVPAKSAAPARTEKPGKKVELAKKPAAVAPAAAKGKKAEPTPPPSLLKGKKEEPKKGAKPAPEAPKGKVGKGKEVVVEVPAPKGVALLAKEGKGKKSSKAAEAAAAKLKRCREPGCDHEFILVGYCRMHYIKNWRRIKRKESILASGQLNNYVEELVNKYPDKYLDVIRQDLATEKEWGKVVVDLELEATDEDSGAEEDIDTVAEGVRPSGGGGGARSEFDDEGDAF